MENRGWAAGQGEAKNTGTIAKAQLLKIRPFLAGDDLTDMKNRVGTCVAILTGIGQSTDTKTVDNKNQGFYCISSITATPALAPLQSAPASNV